MASPDPHPTSSRIRKLQHRLVGRGRAVTTGIGQRWGLQAWRRVRLRLTPSPGELTELRNHVQGHPRLTNPVTLPSTPQQSRTSTTSDCLCLEALSTVPRARQVQTAAPAAQESPGQLRTVLQPVGNTQSLTAASTHTSLQEHSAQNQTPCSQERGNGQPHA